MFQICLTVNVLAIRHLMKFRPYVVDGELTTLTSCPPSSRRPISSGEGHPSNANSKLYSNSSVACIYILSTTPNVYRGSLRFFVSQPATHEILACLMFGIIQAMKGNVTKAKFFHGQSRQELCPLSAWSHRMGMSRILEHK